jgi:hypothetical protein
MWRSGTSVSSFAGAIDDHTRDSVTKFVGVARAVEIRLANHRKLHRTGSLPLTPYSLAEAITAKICRQTG